MPFINLISASLNKRKAENKNTSLLNYIKKLLRYEKR